MVGDKIFYSQETGKYTYNKVPSIFVSGDGGYTWMEVCKLAPPFLHDKRANHTV